MRTISVSVLPILILVLGCGDAAEEATEPDTLAPELSAVEPAAPPPQLPFQAREFLCGDALGVLGRFWEGDNPRVGLSLSTDSLVELPQVESNSGTRYASPDGSIVWSNNGESDQFQFGGETLSCTEVEAGQIEF